MKTFAFHAPLHDYFTFDVFEGKEGKNRSILLEMSFTEDILKERVEWAYAGR